MKLLEKKHFLTSMIIVSFGNQLKMGCC